MSKGRTQLPKMWGGSAFVGKFWLPVILFGASWLLAASSIPNLFSVLFSLVLVVPMVLVGVFFLAVPGQLRPDGDTVCYRKWLRWQIFPSSQVEQISEAFLSLGALKVEGQRMRLLFFIEPENRDLLGFGQHGAESLQIWMDRAAARHKHAHPIVYMLAGVGGFVTTMLLSRTMPQPQTGSGGPTWLVMITDFETHHAVVLGIVVVLVLVTTLIRGVHMNRSERGVIAFLIGFVVAGFFIRPH